MLLRIHDWLTSAGSGIDLFLVHGEKLCFVRSKDGFAARWLDGFGQSYLPMHVI